jgi:hypothetical protein
MTIPEMHGDIRRTRNTWKLRFQHGDPQTPPERRERGVHSIANASEWEA